MSNTIPKACSTCDNFDLADNPYPHCKVKECPNGLGFWDVYNAGIAIKGIHFKEGEQIKL